MSTPPATNDPWAADSSTELPKPSTGGRRWAFLTLAIVLDLVAFGVLAFAYYKIFLQDTNAATESAAATQPSGATIRGAASVAISMREPDFFICKSKRDDLPAGSIVYSSLSEALAKCMAGGTVRIVDQEVYEEQILHGRRSGGTSSISVKIVAEKGPDGKTATLRLPKDAPPGSALVQLENAAGFSMTGLNLDGDGRAEDLILITGNCPGATIDDCRMQGFKRSGIRLTKCEGHDEELGHPVAIRLRGLRFGLPADGFQAEMTPILFLGDNQNVVVQRCRFHGAWPTPVHVEGSLKAAQFDHNLFCGEQKAAIAFGEEPGSAPSLDVTLTNNTFCGCQAALAFRQAPAAGGVVACMNNVFYKVGEGFGLAEGRITLEQIGAVLRGEGNVRDPKTPQGHFAKLANVQCEEMTFELPTKPDTDARWLRYPLNSPLAKAGQNGAYVGGLPPTVE